MRWPWTKRAEAAEGVAARAAESREGARRQWPMVHALAGETRAHHELNGINSLIVGVLHGDDKK